MTFPNLYAELSRVGLAKRDLAPIIEVSAKTLYEKLNGKAPLHWEEAKKIRNEIFPGMNIEYLFSEKESNPNENYSYLRVSEC